MYDDNERRYLLPRVSGYGGRLHQPQAMPNTDFMTPATPRSNRFQFENANNAKSAAQFAAGAPRATPMVPQQAGQMTATLPSGENVSRPATQPVQSDDKRVATDNARRDAFVGRQTRQAEYLHPGMLQDEFAKDANSRENADSGANAGLKGAEARNVDAKTQYMVPSEGRRMDSEAGLNNARREEIGQMLPGKVESQDQTNSRYGQMTPGAVEGQKVQNAVTQQQPAMLQQQIKKQDNEVKRLSTEVQRLGALLARYQNGGTATDKLEREAGVNDVPKAAPAPAIAPAAPSPAAIPVPGFQNTQTAPQPATTQPAAGRQLTPEIAAQFLQQANGDKAAARALARQHGYNF